MHRWVTFHITSKRNSPFTNSLRFAKNINVRKSAWAAPGVAAAVARRAAARRPLHAVVACRISSVAFRCNVVRCALCLIMPRAVLPQDASREMMDTLMRHIAASSKDAKK